MVVVDIWCDWGKGWKISAHFFVMEKTKAMRLFSLKRKKDEEQDSWPNRSLAFFVPLLSQVLERQ